MKTAPGPKELHLRAQREEKAAIIYPSHCLNKGAETLRQKTARRGETPLRHPLCATETVRQDQI